MQFVLWSIRPPKCVISSRAVNEYQQNMLQNFTGSMLDDCMASPVYSYLTEMLGRFTSKFWKELWRLLGTNLRMGSGFHPESSGQVEIFNQLLEQTLRCTIHQLGETRNWVEVLPTIEFAVNNTPNRTTGYSAFYLNYGYHPLHPL